MRNGNGPEDRRRCSTRRESQLRTSTCPPTFRSSAVFSSPRRGETRRLPAAKETSLSSYLRESRSGPTNLTEPRGNGSSRESPHLPPSRGSGGGAIQNKPLIFGGASGGFEGLEPWRLRGIRPLGRVAGRRRFFSLLTLAQSPPASFRRGAVGTARVSAESDRNRGNVAFDWGGSGVAGSDRMRVAPPFFSVSFLTRDLDNVSCSAVRGRARAKHTTFMRPQIRWDYPLNLSILVSGGKETNKDFPSNGERKGKSPALNPPALQGRREM